MKTLKLMIAVAFLGGTLLTAASCGKYDEGPKLSLLTKKQRLCRDWDAKEYVDADGTVTADNDDDVVTFDKDGTYHYTSGSTSFNGEWEFTSDKEKLKVSFTSGNTTISSEVTILRLTNKELWTKEDNGDITKMEAK